MSPWRGKEGRSVQGRQGDPVTSGNKDPVGRPPQDPVFRLSSGIGPSDNPVEVDTEYHP